MGVAVGMGLGAVVGREVRTGCGVGRGRSPTRSMVTVQPRVIPECIKREPKAPGKRQRLALHQTKTPRPRWSSNSTWPGIRKIANAQVSAA